MGIKLRRDLNALAASIDNGVLSVYHFNDVVKEITLTGLPKSISMPKQCTQISTLLNSVCGLISNEEYRVILRFNGMCDLLTKDWVLLHRFETCKLEDIDISICSCGAYYVLGSVHPGYMATLKDGQVFVTVDNTPVTIQLDMSSKINKAMYDWSRVSNDLNAIHVSDNGTDCVVLWADFGDGRTIKLDKFEALISSGFFGGTI